MDALPNCVVGMFAILFLVGCKEQNGIRKESTHSTALSTALAGAGGIADTIDCTNLKDLGPSVVHRDAYIFAANLGHHHCEADPTKSCDQSDDDDDIFEELAHTLANVAENSDRIIIGLQGAWTPAGAFHPRRDDRLMGHLQKFWHGSLTKESIDQYAIIYGKGFKRVSQVRFTDWTHQVGTFHGYATVMLAPVDGNGNQSGPVIPFIDFRFCLDCAEVHATQVDDLRNAMMIEAADRFKTQAIAVGDTNTTLFIASPSSEEACDQGDINACRLIGLQVGQPRSRQDLSWETAIRRCSNGAEIFSEGHLSDGIAILSTKPKRGVRILSPLVGRV